MNDFLIKSLLNVVKNTDGNSTSSSFVPFMLNVCAFIKQLPLKYSVYLFSLVYSLSVFLI